MALVCCVETRSTARCKAPSEARTAKQAGSANWSEMDVHRWTWTSTVCFCSEIHEYYVPERHVLLHFFFLTDYYSPQIR